MCVCVCISVCVHTIAREILFIKGREISYTMNTQRKTSGVVSRRTDKQVDRLGGVLYISIKLEG